MRKKSNKSPGLHAVRVQRGVMRPAILTAKQLCEYVPGADCQCAAWNSSECACPDVDWTPKEIYKLRLSQRELRRKLRNLKKFEAASKRANLIVGGPHNESSYATPEQKP